MSNEPTTEKFSPTTILQDCIGKYDANLQDLAEHLAWERALKYVKQRRSFELLFVRDASRLSEIELDSLNGELLLKQAGGFYSLKATFRNEIGS